MEVLFVLLEAWPERHTRGTVFMEPVINRVLDLLHVAASQSELALQTHCLLLETKQLVALL